MPPKPKTSPETGKIETLKDRYQIFSNGFSADYKNKFQMLYARMAGNYAPAEDYLLPSYETYVDERVSLFQPYSPDIDVKQMLLGSISESSLTEFNTRVGEINDLVRMGENVGVVKNRCFALIRDFLEEEVQGTIEDTLAALESALEI